jgi:uncharacterized protein (DUF2062 family)
MDHFDSAKTPLKKDNRLLAPLFRAYKRFLKIRGRPREIAKGFALGLFVGMTPLMGLHTAIAVPLAALFKWNKISAAIAVWITNAVTAPIIYSITYFVGARIAGIERAFGQISTNGFSGLYKLILKTPEIFWAMTIGGIVLGIPLAVIGYYFTYSVFRKYQEGIRIKIAKSKEKLAHKKKVLQKKRHERHTAAASPHPRLAEQQQNPNYHCPPDN